MGDVGKDLKMTAETKRRTWRFERSPISGSASVLSSSNRMSANAALNEQKAWDSMGSKQDCEKWIVAVNAFFTFFIFLSWMWKPMVVQLKPRQS
jgi:hypothetical protein